MQTGKRPSITIHNGTVREVRPRLIIGADGRTSTVRRLSGLLLASGDWTVATLREYGEQRAERLRRMRRVSRTFAALMTTFTDAGRARRDRYYAASKAGQDHVRTALGAIFLGPERMPSEAFSDQLHQSLLA